MLGPRGECECNLGVCWSVVTDDVDSRRKGVKEKGEFWRCRMVVNYGYWLRHGSVKPVTEFGTSVIYKSL